LYTAQKSNSHYAPQSKCQTKPNHYAPNQSVFKLMVASQWKRIAQCFVPCD